MDRDSDQPPSEVMAYMLDERVPAEERGGLMLWLVAHAAAALLVTAGQGAWFVVTAVRVWRRRHAGWAVALRTGVHRPTLAGLAAVTLIYEIGRRAGVARFIRPVREHAARQGERS